MKAWTILAGATLGFCSSIIATPMVDAASRPGVFQPQGVSATEFGKTLPPIGYVKFCEINPGECVRKKASTVLPVLTPDHWNQLRRVNGYVNASIAPVSDQELYGEVEHWTYPTDAGDCEDYLLLKKRLLEALGFAPGNLLITVVLDEKGEGHAVLTVASGSGDFVLDNRRNEILLWNDTNYKFLKRQSRNDPLQWVALAKPAVISGSTVTSGKAK